MCWVRVIGCLMIDRVTPACVAAALYSWHEVTWLSMKCINSDPPCLQWHWHVASVVCNPSAVVFACAALSVDLPRGIQANRNLA